MDVLIIGGGIGGLTLAQGLKQAGISAAVYERDRTVNDRLQGYRIHISPTGSLALNECLPPHLFDIFDRTCGTPNIAVRFFTEHMRVLLAFEGDLVASTDPIACHRAASRITLRQVLLAGLDNVHFGKTFERYEQRDRGIIAYFADGSSAEGDVLVAADGGGSRVRRQFLPQAQRIDTGVIGIAGKIFLDAARVRGRLALQILPKRRPTYAADHLALCSNLDRPGTPRNPPGPRFPPLRLLRTPADRDRRRAAQPRQAAENP